MSILDNLKVINSIDKQKMLDFLAEFPRQCQEACLLTDRVILKSDYKQVNSILICGMGGSGISGDLLKSYLAQELAIPIEVNKDDMLPGWVDSKTLAFIVSYSGNTRETIYNYHQALQKKAKIIVITSGGKLAELVRKDNFTCICIPVKVVPRLSLAFLFFPMVKILERLQFVSNKTRDLKEAIAVLHKLSVKYNKKVPTKYNFAKQLALRLKDKIPVVYGTNNNLEAVTLRWRNQLNENTKIFAASNVFPELTHNEIECWKNLSVLHKYYYILMVGDYFAKSEDKIRWEYAKKVFKIKKLSFEEISPGGKSLLTRLLSHIYLADFTSAYLALLYHTNPTSMEIIEDLKGKLKNNKFLLIA